MNYEKYIDNISIKNKIARKTWWIISLFLFRPFLGRPFNFWRVFVLKCFGAQIGSGSFVYASTIIPAPWNLKMGQLSTLGPDVKLHIDKVIIGNKVTISQYTYLCGGSHEISSLNLPFFSKPIVIEDFVWVAAECFIGPGVIIHEGSVVGARGCVFKDVEPWTVVGGNPAKFIKKREINTQNNA